MLKVDCQSGPLTHVFMHLPPSGFFLWKSHSAVGVLCTAIVPRC